MRKRCRDVSKKYLSGAGVGVGDFGHDAHDFGRYFPAADSDADAADFVPALSPESHGHGGRVGGGKQPFGPNERAPWTEQRGGHLGGSL